MIFGGLIENGVLYIEKFEVVVLVGVEDLVFDFYKQILFMCIIDFLLEVDGVIGFIEVFIYLCIGVFCVDWIGLMNVIFVEGINFGLCKMVDVINIYIFWELICIG